ncbi:hypothetical protein PTE30175_04321 [Pandoraea terrae]|uniref:HTH luxR-type domain-containing protein n=1 Tax=Pandoraea terrae TaxID=1537710 RepID=A0A5E4YD48_9BURK|nr:hypothetical protein [Pandoraea terrae]VVE46245.1 hypothetical protein PTE30175_04321 [Pandoraea terrae]
MKGQADLRAYLRQLSRVGLGSLLVMPEWLAAAGRGFGADGVACVWLDRTLRPGDVYAPDLNGEARLQMAGHLANLTGAPQAPGHPGSRMPTPPPGGLAGGYAIGWWRALYRAGHGGDLAPWLMQAGQFADALDGWIRLPNGTAMLALMLRRARSGPFHASDVRRFGPLLGDLADGLTQAHAETAAGVAPASMPACAPPGDAFDAPGAEGTMVMRAGRPEWLDQGAQGLLCMRLQARPGGGGWPEIAPVAQTCRELAAEASTGAPRDAGNMAPDARNREADCGVSVTGQGWPQCDSPPEPAERRIVVPGGCVTVRAMRLRSPGGRPTDRVGISIRHQPPRAVRLLRQLRATALSPLQREIAYRLACGQSRAEIREACAIGAETLKTHISQIRIRLHPCGDAALLADVGLAPGPPPLGAGGGRFAT